MNFHNATSLRRHQVTVFQEYDTMMSYDAWGKYIQTTNMMIPWLEQKEAYTVLYNAAIDEFPDLGFVDMYGNPKDPIVLVGDAVWDVFPAIPKCSPASCAMAGKNITTDLPDQLHMYGMTIPVDHNVKAENIFFDAYAGPTKLDDEIVMCLLLNNFPTYGAQQPVK